MNEEHKTVALWVRGHAEKLLTDAAGRQKEVQAEEVADAELTGRQPRLMKVEPVVEIPTPVLAAILEAIGDKVPSDAVVAEHVASYRKHCKFMRGQGTTNVLAHQYIAVLNAAGVKEPPDASSKKTEGPSA